MLSFLRGGIPWPKGNVPESLGQAILVGIILVGRLGVLTPTPLEGASLANRLAASVPAPNTKLGHVCRKAN